VPYQGPFELCDPGEHGQNHPAGVVVSAQGSSSDCNPLLFFNNHLGDAQQLSGRASQTIEPGNDEDILGAHFPQQLLQRGPLLGARDRRSAPRSFDIGNGTTCFAHLFP
jgi:hypothetical protein